MNQTDRHWFEDDHKLIYVLDEGTELDDLTMGMLQYHRPKCFLAPEAYDEEQLQYDVTPFALLADSFRHAWRRSQIVSFIGDLLAMEDERIELMIPAEQMIWELDHLYLDNEKRWKCFIVPENRVLEDQTLENESLEDKTLEDSTLIAELEPLEKRIFPLLDQVIEYIAFSKEEDRSYAVDLMDWIHAEDLLALKRWVKEEQRVDQHLHENSDPVMKDKGKHSMKQGNSDAEKHNHERRTMDSNHHANKHNNAQTPKHSDREAQTETKNLQTDSTTSMQAGDDLLIVTDTVTQQPQNSLLKNFSYDSLLNQPSSALITEKNMGLWSKLRYRIQNASKEYQQKQEEKAKEKRRQKEEKKLLQIKKIRTFPLKPKQEGTVRNEDAKL